MFALLLRSKWSALVLGPATALLILTGWAAPAQADEAAALSKLEIIALLQARRFEALEAHLLSGPWDETRGCCLRGLRAFKHSDPANEAHLTAWVEARPKSFVARMARARYFDHIGWLVRGEGYLHQTHRSRFVEMRGYFERAVGDYRAALEINPRIELAYERLINTGMVMSHADMVQQAFAEGLQSLPDSAEIRSSYLFARQPKWGGDPLHFWGYWASLKLRHLLDEDYAFLDAHLPWNSEDAIDALFKEERYEEALRDLDELLEAEDRAKHRRARAKALWRLKRLPEAIEEIERAVALAPFWDELQVDRQFYYWLNRDIESARAALDLYVELDPYDPHRLLNRAGIYANRFVLSYKWTDKKAYRALLQQAFEDLDRAEVYGAADQKVASVRAEVHREAESDPAKVVEARRRAVELSPREARYWKDYALALYDVADCEALSVLRQYVSLCRAGRGCEVDYQFHNRLHDSGNLDACFGMTRIPPPGPATFDDPDAPTPLERLFPVCGRFFRTPPTSVGLARCLELAEAGDLGAQYEVAKLSLSGIVGQGNLERGLKWLRTATDQGHAMALTDLGRGYLYGLKGLQQDTAQGLALLEQAMQAGESEAFEILGRAYYFGQELPVDRRRSRDLIDRAIALGSEEARRKRKRYFPDEG